MKIKRGISLIVLVITIIVIIILAGAIILSLSDNSPIASANKATFEANVATYNSQLALAISNEYLQKSSFNPGTFNKGIWSGGEITGTIKQYITSITDSDAKKFEIQSGKLVYVGEDETEKTWSTDIGILVGNALDLTAPTVAYGTNGVADVQTASTTVTLTDVGGSNLNESTLQYVWDTQNVTTPASGWTVFTNGQTLTKGSVNGTYYLWIKAEDNAGNSVVSKSNAFTLVQPVAANKPVLTAGMTAKTWNSTTSTWDTVASPDTDTSWYNYTNKQWANAQTADGSMWVWIPRYEYKIPTPHTSAAQTIDVKFIQDISIAADSGYTIHPAFTFGTTELTGMWVAKFTASGTTSAVASKPNVSPITNITINDMFTACRNMEALNGTQYGWGTSGSRIDTHLMKNTEWGAVAYLSASKYGKTGEVWINPYFSGTWDANTFKTGQAGISASVNNTTATYAYNTTTYGVNASTSGTVYGVYDMSGCAYQRTAAYVNNGNSYLNTYGSSLVTASSQYKDVYISSGDTQNGNYSANSSKMGDAIYETSTDAGMKLSWNSDESFMPYSNVPFFVRGGYSACADSAGVFAFNMSDGRVSLTCGFRPVLAVSDLL